MSILVIIFAVTAYFAYLVEKHKKDFDIQTYKEIVAFNEGKNYLLTKSLWRSAKDLIKNCYLA